MQFFFWSCIFSSSVALYPCFLFCHTFLFSILSFTHTRVFVDYCLMAHFSLTLSAKEKYAVEHCCGAYCDILHVCKGDDSRTRSLFIHSQRNAYLDAHCTSDLLLMLLMLAVIRKRWQKIHHCVTVNHQIKCDILCTLFVILAARYVIPDMLNVILSVVKRNVCI